MSRVFDASASNYLIAASNAAYNVGANGNAWSIAAWAKRADQGVDMRHILRQGAGGPSYGMRFTIGNALNAVSGYTSFDSTGTITDTTTWHHVAVTWAAAFGTITLYIDGASDGTGGAYTVSGQGDIYVGIAETLDRAFNGKLAYVTVWNTGLTAGNITTLQTSITPELVGSGCVASWHLDTSALTDSSATANDLTVTGTVAFDSDNPLPLGAAVAPAWTRTSYFPRALPGRRRRGKIGYRRPLFASTQQVVETDGASVGLGTADAVGTALTAATTASTGLGTATGIGQATATAVAASTGVGTAASTSGATAGSVAASSGVATAAASASATAEAVGASAGVGSAQASASAFAESAGSAAGVATVVASAQALATAVSASAGIGSAAADATNAAAAGADATADGLGTATGLGQATAVAVAASAGLATVSAAGQVLAASVGVSEGTSFVAADGEAHGAAVVPTSPTGGGSGHPVLGPSVYWQGGRRRRRRRHATQELFDALEATLCELVYGPDEVVAPAPVALAPGPRRDQIHAALAELTEVAAEYDDLLARVAALKAQIDAAEQRRREEEIEEDDLVLMSLV